jgi:hypothetical protein
MIAKKHFILLFMLIAYSIPISYVYMTGRHESVSHIICSESCQRIIMLSMLTMGWFTLWYEWERNDPLSFMYIALLLVGIYGLLWMDESHTIHYVFATCVFLSMLGFMYHHRYHHSFLTILVIIQMCITGLLLYYINGDMFLPEILLISNFGLYYLCLHFMES